MRCVNLQGTAIKEEQGKNWSFMCTILQQANKPIKKRFQSFLSPPLLKFVISATTATTILPNLL